MTQETPVPGVTRDLARSFTQEVPDQVRDEGHLS